MTNNHDENVDQNQDNGGYDDNHVDDIFENHQNIVPLCLATGGG